MSTFLGKPLESFLDLVASKEPGPSAGAVAAVTTAMAASLVEMAARLSTSQLTDAGQIAEHAAELHRHAASLAEEDASAYDSALSALRAGNAERIQETLTAATKTPLAIAAIGVEVANIAAQLTETGNPAVRGDAMSAAILAEAVVRCCAELVRTNVEAGELDDALRQRAEEYLMATEDPIRRLHEST